MRSQNDEAAGIAPIDDADAEPPLSWSGVIAASVMALMFAMLAAVVVTMML
jgi:hypothetical protein